MDKAELLSKGVDLAREFCQANSLTMPNVVECAKADWRLGDITCAYYRKDVISICAAQCAHVGTAGRAWSFPGYVVDRTPYGVIAHELGHHVDYVRSENKTLYGGEFSDRLRTASGEQRLTSYCPNSMEWFAEMFRLFVTNSDLLKHVKPRTYSYLREWYQPVVDAPWRVVLKDAPERTIIAAQRKIVT